MSRVAVVGLGLIGGSLALAVSARGYDHSPEVRERARRRGIDTADSLEDALAGAEIVVTAVPTGQTPALLRDISSIVPDAILTDTASLKKPMVAAAQTLRSSVRFVAGHPMAGARRHGIEAASPEIFRDRPWILTPTARSDARAIEAVSNLVRSAGARPIVLEAGRHDRAMTWISHLPHAVAASLARAAGRETGADLAELAGPGFLDATRIAARRLELALELALADPEALASAIDSVREELGRLAGALRQADQEAIERFFEDAASVRRGLDRGASPGSSGDKGHLG